MRRFLCGATPVFALLLLAGCASTQEIRGAKDAFGKAKAAGAESKAPYEYYAAEAYLERMDHEVGEGDQKAAREFAKESRMHSEEALRISGGGAK